MMRQWDSREEFWGYLATFLHTTQTAEIRTPYQDLNDLLKGKISLSLQPIRILSL